MVVVITVVSSSIIDREIFVMVSKPVDSSVFAEALLFGFALNLDLVATSTKIGIDLGETDCVSLALRRE